MSKIVRRCRMTVKHRVTVTGYSAYKNRREGPADPLKADAFLVTVS